MERGSTAFFHVSTTWGSVPNEESNYGGISFFTLVARPPVRPSTVEVSWRGCRLSTSSSSSLAGGSRFRSKSWHLRPPPLVFVPLPFTPFLPLSSKCSSCALLNPFPSVDCFIPPAEIRSSSSVIEECEYQHGQNQTVRDLMAVRLASLDRSRATTVVWSRKKKLVSRIRWCDYTTFWCLRWSLSIS